jgi:predicted small lipoprotein YifL
MSPRSLTVLALAAAAALGACGKVGPLERPGPMTGSAAAAAPAPGPAPVKNIDPRDPGYDPTTDPSPPRSQPIQGSGSNPAGYGPPGVLPDPYRNPNR